MGIMPPVILDLTPREFESYARGVDADTRAKMASMLWAAHSQAAFMGFVWGGKRLPSIEARIRRIMNPGKRQTEVASVIAQMNAIAIRAGMPPPRPRGKGN